MDVKTRRKFGKGTQNWDLLAMLQSGGRITALDALAKFRCFRLASRVCDLRRAGYAVLSERVDDPVTGKHWAVYFMKKGRF